MDPNVALESARRLCREIDRLEMVGEAVQVATLASELVDVVIGLDSWLASGGFLPDAWKC